jgi:hypothetical protein
MTDGNRRHGGEREPGTLAPDHDRDVVVHAFAAVDALTGEALGEGWSVRCGRESTGSFDSEDEALAAARAAAADAGDRPVWLLRPGRPPVLVEPG